MNWYSDMGLINVLVVGSGAREHALVWKLLLSHQVERVYVAPGNGGTSLLAVPAPYEANSVAGINVLLNWVMQRDIAFTLVGPEVPLAEGIADEFAAMRQPIVGPTKEAARIESSKDWAKQFMLRHNIPTAHATTFDEFEPLRQYLLASDTSYPLVLKEDRLLAGKGVTIVRSRTEAIVWLARITGATIDRVTAADFKPILAAAMAAPALPTAGLPIPSADALANSGSDEDILAAAIVKGMTAAQVEAIMRGDTISREQILGEPPEAPATEDAPVETRSGESSNETEATAEAPATAKASNEAAVDGGNTAPGEDPLANDEFYRKLRYDRTEFFRREGRKVLVEEYLEGPEVSVLAFTDGKTVKLMPPVCDYKRLGDGDSGPMTGGMGAYSPTSLLSGETLDWIRENIIETAVKGMAEEGYPYKGIIYAGLILTADGPKVLEFNSRFGDPETQVLMMLLESDLVEICQAIIEERLAEQDVQWSSDACVAVVLATPGYPEVPVTGQLIHGLDDVEMGVRVFHAGTRASAALNDIAAELGGGERPSKKKKIDWRTFLGRIDVPDWFTASDKGTVKAMTNEGRIELRTSGGRVLTVAAKAPTLAEAREIAYRNAALITFPGKQMRRDIALREVPPPAEPPAEDAPPTAATEETNTGEAAQLIAAAEQEASEGQLIASNEAQDVTAPQAATPSDEQASKGEQLIAPPDEQGAPQTIASEDGQSSAETPLVAPGAEENHDGEDPAPAIGEAIGAAAGIEPAGSEIPAVESATEETQSSTLLNTEDGGLQLGYTDEERAAKLKEMDAASGLESGQADKPDLSS